MSYQLDGDWRVWNARLVADASILKEMRRAGMPSSSIAADTLKAMGHLAAEWHKAVMEMDKSHREQLEPTAVEQFLGVVRDLDDLSVLLLMLPDAVDPHRHDRARR